MKEGGQFSSSSGLLSVACYGMERKSVSEPTRERERERKSFHIHVPSPAGLIGWNIQHIPIRSWQHVQQRHYGHKRLTNVVTMGGATAASYMTGMRLAIAIKTGVDSHQVPRCLVKRLFLLPMPGLDLLRCI